MDTWVYLVIGIVVLSLACVLYIRHGVKLGQKRAPRRWKIYVRSGRAARIAKARTLERVGLKKPSAKLQVDDVSTEMALNIYNKNKETRRIRRL